MDKGSKVLGWLGLVVGGALSVGANIRSIHLPGMPSADVGAYVVAVAPVALAMLGIEQVARWKHLPNPLRFGIVGMASLIAAVASWTHIVSVMKFYGQAELIAYSFPLAVDGIMLLSSLSLFVSFPDKRTPDTDTPMVARAWTPAPDMSELDADTLEPLTDADKAVLSGTPDTDMDSTPSPDSFAPDTVDTDTLHALVPATRDMDTTDSEPVTVPAPRRTARTDTGWRVLAREALSLGYAPAEIAGAILENEPGTWPSPEAGRKAVSRLR